jgi:putative transcriptional regulator
MAYHYTESGLRNVYLENGYTVHETPYGEAVSINDVDGLHRAIGTSIAKKARLTGSELRFLRKELGLSQRALALLIGSSEQNVSLWERRGRMPRLADRIVRLLYLEAAEGNLKIKNALEALVEVDEHPSDRLAFHAENGGWKEAA